MQLLIQFTGARGRCVCNLHNETMGRTQTLSLMSQLLLIEGGVASFLDHQIAGRIGNGNASELHKIKTPPSRVSHYVRQE